MSFGSSSNGTGNGGNGPEYVSIGSVDKPWGEVIPDVYWETEVLLGRTVTLVIVDVLLEQYPDSPPRPVMKFREDARLLRLRRDLRTTLKEYFGESPARCIGKTIRLTAGQNQMKQIVIKILPPLQEQAGYPVQNHGNQPGLAHMNAGPLNLQQLPQGYQAPFQPGPVYQQTPPYTQQVQQPTGPQVLQNAYPGQGAVQPGPQNYSQADIQAFLQSRQQQGGQPNPPNGTPSPTSP